MKLITVILIDDDYLVLQDLKTLVNWEMLGFQIIGTAANGKKALSLFEKYRPQLIISDISMPVMDGLDFIETIRKDYPDIQIIIISSYADFQYAKRAISNGVEDYLLKNEITKEGLTHKLNKIAKSFSHTKQNAQRSLRFALSDYFLSTEPDYALFTDRPGEDSSYTSLLPLLRQKYFFYIYSIQLPLEKLNLHFGRIEKSGKKLVHYFSGLSYEDYQAAIMLYLENYAILGVEIPLSKGLQKNAYYSFGKKLLYKLSGHFEEPVLGFFYPERFDIHEFKVLYRRLISLFNFYSTFPIGKFMNIRDLENQKLIPTVQHFNYSLIQNSRNHPEDYLVKLKEYTALLFKNKDIDTIALLFHNSILQFEELTNYTLLFQNPEYMCGASEFINFFKNAYEPCVLTLQKNSDQRYSSTVNKVIKYMKSNFADSSLTAEQIADQVLLSAGRLSVLFKQETGTTINDYLTDLRIQYAIHLLENTNYKIYEITEQIGYKSSQYFSQVFNQRTGKRPLDYRKSKN